MVVGGGWVGWGGVCKVIFMTNLSVVLRLGWGFDNFNAILVLPSERENDGGRERMCVKAFCLLF